MLARRGRGLASSFVALLCASLSGSCSSAPPASNGSCVVDSRPELGCDIAADAGAANAPALVGYTCTGTARPDEDARYAEGVPAGILCADRGSIDNDGRNSYCCTPYTTPCAYNPIAICDPGTYGYQCRGSDRPESLNSQLFCGQGVHEGDLIDYCCSAEKPNPGCQQSDALGCSSQLMGFTCRDSNIPKAEELGANKSRSDYYYMVCSTPKPAANPVYNNYCCYAPALVPIGGTCVSDIKVPGCEPGRFGFACYGPDTPGEDYLPMHCPEPGFAGTSAEGYPATLYCCDFQ